MNKEKLNKFSVPLGLLDYVNPILYTITMITICSNLYSKMDSPFNIILIIGAIISILVGLVIPTGKVIVGLGIIEFVMPVSLVFCVNLGILITGLMLLKYVLSISFIVLLIILILIISLLCSIYSKNKKINTVAVLTGAIGYLMIYVSLIVLSISTGVFIPIIFYVLAILLFVMLCCIGINGNLKNPMVHWVIEISNVLCQLFVCIGTIILFR